jgi:hypothetical protein
MVEQYEVNGSEDNSKDMSCNPESPANVEVGSRDTFEDILNVD